MSQISGSNIYEVVWRLSIVICKHSRPCPNWIASQTTAAPAVNICRPVCKRGGRNQTAADTENYGALLPHSFPLGCTHHVNFFRSFRWNNWKLSGFYVESGFSTRRPCCRQEKDGADDAWKGKIGYGRVTFHSRPATSLPFRAPLYCSRRTCTSYALVNYTCKVRWSIAEIGNAYNNRRRKSGQKHKLKFSCDIRSYSIRYNTRKITGRTVKSVMQDRRLKICKLCTCPN